MMPSQTPNLPPSGNPRPWQRLWARIRPSKRTLSVAVCLVAILGVATFMAVREGVQNKVSQSHAASCTPNAILVNPCRPWYGASVGKYPQVTSDTRAQVLYHEQRIGHQVDIVHTYHPVGSNKLSADDIYFATRVNTMLFTNWKPASNWASASGGNATVNASIDQMANSIKSLGSTKIFLTIHHEPENDVSGGASSCSNITYKGSFGTPADYRAMWRNVRNRFNALGVNNVVWVMDYMNYKPWDCLIGDLYPGNDLVDWVMFNAYSGGSLNFSGNVSHFYNLLTATDDATHDYLSKPWGIVEWNVARATPTQEDDYYDQAKASVEKDEFPRLKAYMIFDNIGPDGTENRVAYDDNGVFDATKMAHYKAFADSTVFTGSPTPPPPSVNPTPSPPSAVIKASDGQAVVNAEVDGTAQTGQLLTLNPGNIISPTTVKSISRVEYYDSGKLVQTVTQPPFALDTSRLRAGRHSITERTYYVDGSMSSRTQGVSITATLTAHKTTGKPWGWIIVGVAALTSGAALYLVRKRFAR